MSLITSTEAGATGRYINLGTPASQNGVGEQTIIVYAKPTGSGGGGFGYEFAKTPSGSTSGPRLFVNHNSNAPLVGFGVSSSGAAGSPQRHGTANDIVYGTWQHQEITWDGSLNYTGIHIYIDGTESTYGFGSAANGVTAISSDSSDDLFMMNRGNAATLAREFVGDIAYIARWNRVLTSGERTTVRTSGPLGVPSGLILCWANQADLGPNSLSVTARTTHVDGSTPTLTTLGDPLEITATYGTAAATGYDATIDNGGTDLNISATYGTAAATGYTANIDKQFSLVASYGTAAATGYTASISFDTAPVIHDDFERSSVNLSSSTVVGVGDTAVISIYPRVQSSEVSGGITAWLEPSAKITGVNGTRPTFEFLSYITASSNGKYWGQPWQVGRLPMYSYDRAIWHRFDTAVTIDTVNHKIVFRNSTVFTSDTVYITREREFGATDAGTWITTLSGLHSFVEPTTTAAAFSPVHCTSYPAQTFIADEYSQQTNELSATVPYTPLYGFQINDTSLPPASGTKKLAVVFGGVHAGEDLANHALKAFIEYVCGTSSYAQTIRRNFLIFCYPLLNAPGRVGGHWRGSFQNDGSANDLNRHFSDVGSALEIVVKPRTAITTDLNGVVPSWMFDFHGDYGVSSTTVAAYYGGASATQLRFKSAWEAYQGSTDSLGTPNAGFTTEYFKTAIGCTYTQTVEINDASPVSDATLVTIGTNIGKAISDLEDAGAFGIDAEYGVATATGYTATVTLANDLNITATYGTASATDYTANVDRQITIAATYAAAAATGYLANVDMQSHIVASYGTASAVGYKASIKGQPGGPLAGTGVLQSKTYIGVGVGI